jgi:hypothetical protein
MMAKLTAPPRALWFWLAAIALIAAGTALALPYVGPSLDFAHDGRVAGHIADRSLTPIPVVQNAAGAWPLLLAYLGAFGLACAAYVAVLRVPDLQAAHVWIAFGLGAALLVTVPFFPTSDPYAYALYALESGPLHLDPYTVQSVAGAASPWAGALAAMFPDPQAYVRVCNYGPLSVFAHALLALPLARAPLAVFLIAERVFGIVCIGLTGLALMRTAPQAEGVRRAASYLLHPLVLCEFVAFAHGDALMLAFLSFAYLAWRRRRFGLCAALCVAALATRSVAALALVTLLVALVRTRPSALPRALAGAGLAALAIASASLLAYGDVSLGGAPAFNRFAAPILFALTAFGSSSALVVGVFGQAAIGAGVALALFRTWWATPKSAVLAWLPIAALAALPAVYPHYVTWVAGVAALRPAGRFGLVARVVTFTAPVWYVARMNLIAPPQPSELAYALALAVAWGGAGLALWFAYHGRAVAAASPPASLSVSA